MSYRTEYADVPSADGAEVDPHWIALQQGSNLPGSYLPAIVPGQQVGWRRVAVWVLIVMLVSVTTAGVCLTYGPDELFRFLRS
jgi:hypothetical protein